MVSVEGGSYAIEVINSITIGMAIVDCDGSSSSLSFHDSGRIVDASGIFG